MNLLHVVDFSHSIFFIHDSSITCPGLDWRDAHTAQGFARNEGVVNLGMTQEFGVAVVAYGTAQVPWPSCDRAFVVPFHCSSGLVLLSGAENPPPYGEIPVGADDYMLTIALRVARAGRRPVVEIYLGFEPRAEGMDAHSQVLKLESGMRVPEIIDEKAQFL